MSFLKWNHNKIVLFSKDTHTTAGCYGDLNSVTSWLAHVFQVQGLVRGLVVTSFDA